jgi:hypothetical protein
MSAAPLPALPYEEWQPTRDTLHMYTQVIGKLRLALSPFEPEWAHVALYVTARGLTTSPMPAGARSIDVELDLVDHVAVLRSSDGRLERRPLGGPVAEFYGDIIDAMQRLDAAVSISTMPQEVPDPIPFPDDRTHATYDTGHAGRFHQVLSIVDSAVKEHRAGFRGRTTPVHFFWGSFDLALARYSGRPVPPPPGAGVIERIGGDAEEVCCGWWPGDHRFGYPAFYAYAYPKPDGLERAAIAPASAAWSDTAGEFLLSHDAAAQAPDPHAEIRAFLTSTYDASANALGWDRGLTDVTPPTAAKRAQPS